MVELFLLTDWFTARDQQMVDIVLDSLAGGWSMLALPVYWLYSSRADSWPGWTTRPRPALTPFTVVLAGLPLLPLPRLKPRPLPAPRPGRFSYLRIGRPPHLPDSRIKWSSYNIRNSRKTKVILVQECNELYAV